MSSLFRELKVVRRAFPPKHYPIEAVMVLKLMNYRQTETIAVKPQKPAEVIAGSRDPDGRNVHSDGLTLRFAPPIPQAAILSEKPAAMAAVACEVYNPVYAVRAAAMAEARERI